MHPLQSLYQRLALMCRRVSQRRRQVLRDWAQNFQAKYLKSYLVNLMQMRDSIDLTQMS